MMRKLIIRYSLSVCCMVLLPLMIQAEHDRLGEYRIKAAYLYNFAKFVEWPDTSFDTPDAPIVLCVLGDWPLDNGLESIDNKMIRERQLKIRYCRNSEDLNKCHILFISNSEDVNLEKILSKVKDLPILTVGDSKIFTRMGGIINFIRVENKIRFEVNPMAAENASIKISSRLLKIAKLVQ